MSREEWDSGNVDDIDPEKYAGEAWFNTEEYPIPDPGMSKHLQGEIGREDDYYPGARRRGQRFTP